MGRSPCCEKVHTNKGAWTKEEDERLINYIRVHGEGCWRSLPKSAGLLRCGKSCRLRWINYLRPDLKRGNFTEEEDEIIIKFHSLLGNKWSLIAGRLPGRTDNEIKNYWNTHIKRKLINRGIDPQNHRPLNAPATNTTTAAATTTHVTTTTPTNICLDFKNSTSSFSPSNDRINLNMNQGSNKFKSDSSSAEDTNSTSGTTEETLPQNQHREEQLNQVLDLELSIGLPSRQNTNITTSSDSEESNNSFKHLKVATPSPTSQLTATATIMAQAVCLCWQLGFQNDQLCCNCQTTKGIYRYC